MANIKSEKELFDYIRSADIKKIPSLKAILAEYSIPKVSIQDLLKKIKYNEGKILLLDARSEKEFFETSIPHSINFPVLNNIQRHEVGLIYKKYSQTSALWLAMQHANPKMEALRIFLDKNNAREKEIIVNCWRGGGRSSYLAKMICDLDYKPGTLIGGYKSYRKLVNEFFSAEEFPYELIELSGLTGCGKSELLQSVSGLVPVIDLESSARHFSSLLGFVPYEIKNYEPVKYQSAFENNIFSQIYFGLTSPTEQTVFLIESESKRVGNFEIPKALYQKLLKAPSVKIICSMENRVKRIVRDYFGDEMRGIGPMKKILIEKENFFKQHLSGKVYSELILLLDKLRVYEFTEIMIREYYDRKYKDKGKRNIAVVSTDNMENAKKEILSIYSETAAGKDWD